VGAVAAIQDCVFEGNRRSIFLQGFLEGKNNCFSGGDVGVETRANSRIFLKNDRFSGQETALCIGGDGDLWRLCCEGVGLGLRAAEGADVLLRKGDFRDLGRGIELAGKGHVFGTRIYGAEKGGIYVDKSGALVMEGCRVRRSAPGLVSLSPRVKTRRCLFWDNRFEWKLPDLLGV
jgi:hypothetical protein